MRMSVISTYEKKGGVKSALCFVLASLIAILGILIWINVKLRPLVTSVTRGYAQNAVSYALNKLIEEQLKTDDYSFIDIRTDQEGKVIAVSMDVTDTNLLRSRLIMALEDRIACLEPTVVKIPLGNFTRQPFLSGLGPKVPVRFLMLPSFSINVSDSFKTSGINQTLYTVSLDVTSNVGIYIPTMSSSVELKTNIPVAQTVIVGQVPDSYTDVSGVEGSRGDTVLNLD